MPSLNAAARAYASSTVARSARYQEADVFRLVIARLQAARHAGAMARVRALADNRRLWTTVGDLMRDMRNPLPPETRKGLIEIGMSVHRAMDADEPDFDFLIAVNKDIAEGLSGSP